MTTADLDTLYREAGLTAFAGVRAGDHLMYIAEAGSKLMPALKRSKHPARPAHHSGRQDAPRGPAGG
jgi:hypothetical protein